MQCPSCEFYNMPGAAVCGRCGSTLRAGTLTIDVHPPRAGTLAKRLRRWLPTPLAYRLRDESMRVAEQSRRAVTGWGFAAPPPGTVPRMVVPGWALMHTGERTRGRLFLGASLTLLLLALAFYGTVFGSLCLGLAFGAHVGSCLSVMRLSWSARGAAVTTAAVLALALFLVVYLPAGWAVSRWATPIVLDYAAPPLAVGDVLLLNPRAYVNGPPRPGDVVLYRQAYRQLRHPTNGPAFVIAEGEVIDRVLAGPGDQVRWEKGRVWVNGQETPHLPLNPRRPPDGLKWTVPANCYVILPTASVAINPQITPEIWQQVGLVPDWSIRGRVYFRTQPLSRWGRID
jgi:signal peptidase I